MKKSKLTYAQKAKQIVAKYKKRLGDDFERFDKLSTDAMNHELAQLMEQQENAKAASVENQYQEMAYGGDLPFMQNAPQYMEPTMPLNYSYVNPITGEPTSTNYNAYTSPVQDVNYKLAPRRQTKEDIEAYRAQIQEGIKRAEKMQKKYGRKEKNPYYFGYAEDSGGRKLGLFHMAKEHGGTLPKLAGGGVANPYAPQTPRYATFEDDPNLVIPPLTAFDASAYGPENQTYLNAYRSLNKPATLNNTNIKKNPSWWSEIPTESKVGTASQLAGVLGSGIIALTAGKPKSLDFNPTYAPEMEMVDNSEQLAAARRSYRGAANSLRYLSPSQYMAAMNNLTAQEAATKAGIIEGTNNTNAGIRNDAAWKETALNQANEEGRMRVAAMNEAARLGYVNNVGQMLTNTAGVVAGFTKDESMRKMQSDMMQFMSQSNYGSKTINGRIVRTNRLGDLEYYTDPQGYPHWEYAGQPITQDVFLQKVNEHYKRINP